MMYNRDTLNWKKIGKHIFLSPLYSIGIAAALGLGYFLWLAISSFAVWLFSDWFNFLIAIGAIWAFALVTYIIDKIDSDLLFD